MDALRAGNDLGGFFALSVGVEGDGWRPLAELVTQPGAMPAHIDRTRAALAASNRVAIADIEPRVAASLAHLGLAARMVSPALAAVSSAGWVPDLDLAHLSWQPEGGSPVPLRLDGLSGTWVRTPAEAAAALRARVVESALRPLEAAVESAVAVSPHVLTGNTWSAFAGALAPLRIQRPDLWPTAGSIVAELRVGEPDAGAVDDVTGRFRRSTCCLYYRLPRGGLCGDCVLDEAPARTGR